VRLLLIQLRVEFASLSNFVLNYVLDEGLPHLGAREDLVLADLGRQVHANAINHIADDHGHRHDGLKLLQVSGVRHRVELVYESGYKPAERHKAGLSGDSARHRHLFEEGAHLVLDFW